MPLIAEAVQVTVRGTMDLHNWANVFHVEPSETIGPNGQALAVLDHYVSDILPLLTSDVQVVDAAYVDLQDDTGPSGIVTPTLPADLVGGVDAPACPPNTTYLVRYGGLSARGVRNGRSYLPGVREDEVSNGGTITPETTGDVQDACTLFISGVLADADAPLVTLHTPSTGDPFTTEILGCSVSNLVATQRRRLRN
jgi:hypothetical protein